MANQDNSGGKRERVDTPGGSRYVERDSEGKFKDNQDIGKAHGQDVKKEAENESEKGRGNRGDRKE